MKECTFRRLRAAGLAGFLPFAAVSAADADDIRFPTRAAAEEHCPGQVVVWVDLETRIFYYRGQDRYGSTKSGAYLCERDVKGAGYRPNRTGR
jgi:hypothetical protein